MNHDAWNRTWRPHPMSVHVLRLQPGRDLKRALDELAESERIRAGIVLTCVGSLKRAVLRLADGIDVTELEQPFEILSLVGTVSEAGSHLHVGLADALGTTIGGHLKEGSIVHTTAEIAIGVIAGMRFEREPDAATGYRELVITEE
jgi:predicted DNA-binding protein with PD1-like motif